MRPRRRISPAADEFARSGKGTGEARRTVFDEYLRELQKVTLLTPAEEAAFWQRYRHGGDVESRLRLIEAYQPLVFTREDPREVASVLRISLSHFYRLQKQAIERVRAMIRAPAPHPEAP